MDKKVIEKNAFVTFLCIGSHMSIKDYIQTEGVKELTSFKMVLCWILTVYLHLYKVRYMKISDRLRNIGLLSWCIAKEENIPVLQNLWVISIWVRKQELA